MRAIMAQHLRDMYPSARIIHELPLRYSSRRIDLAAVTRAGIVAVEIKSSRDTPERLEAQLRGFGPIVTKLIVALAPKWLAPPPVKTRVVRSGPQKGTTITSIPYAPVLASIRELGFDHIEVMGEPKRVYSSFVKGYETLPVRIAG